MMIFIFHRWHDVDLHRKLGVLTLRVDNTSLVLAKTSTSFGGPNSNDKTIHTEVNLRPYLLQESLQNNPSKAADLVTTVGDEFTG